MARTYAPTGATGLESSVTLRHASPFSKTHVFDREIRELFNFDSIGYDLASTADNLESHGTGNPELAEINSSEICGFTVANSNDSLGFLWVIPQNIDLTGTIDFRFFWTETGTSSSGSALFAPLYTPLTTDTTALAIGATALDTTIDADAPVATANAFQATGWGSISASKTGVVTLTPGMDCLACKVKCTLSTITDATLHQGQVRFYRAYV